MLVLRLSFVFCVTLVVVTLRRLVGRRRHPAWTWRLEVAAEMARYAASLTSGVEPAEVRAALRPAALPPRLARQVGVEAVAVAELDAERLTPAGWREGEPELLWLHGGGYVMCSPATHRDLVARIARATGARCWVIDYRLAPEFPFPAGLDDCHRAYRALLGDGVAPERLLIGGDSAGGGLALSLMVRLRDRGEPLPAGAILLSPWVDLAATGSSIRDNEPYDYLRGDLIDVVAGWYVQEASRADPAASPLYADLRGLPPLYVQTGGAELLRSENEELVAQARAAGVDVVHDVRPGFVHVTQGFARFLPEAREAIAALRPFARSRCA